MKCQQIRDMFHKYLDQELEASDQAKMNHHLESCAACSEEWQNLNHISAMLSQLPKVTPPYPLVDQVISQYQRKPYSRFKRFISHRNTWQAAAGTIAACFAFAIVILQTNQPIANVSDEMPQSLSTYDKQMEKNSSVANGSVDHGSVADKFVATENVGSESIQTDPNHGVTETNMVESNDASKKAPDLDMTKNGVAPIQPLAVPLVSLDEQYVATILDQQVMIYNQKDQQIVFQSIFVWKPGDQIVLQAWSPASELTYSVTHNSQEQWYRIDLIQSTENAIATP
jgi:hypothetical protein